ncbi:MAG: hypothetical protein OEX00_10135 [Gammaproteobacteria bacterium]|nr:hypothetical protein [Gammaproteobacteria bacterium]MDH5692207.1 hypothetical protein [Gammaproteobacteria bacterium]
MQINGTNRSGFYPGSNSAQKPRQKVSPAYPASNVGERSSSPSKPEKPQPSPARRLPPAGRERIPRTAHPQTLAQAYQSKSNTEREAVRADDLSPYARKALAAYTRDQSPEEKEQLSIAIGIDLYV